MGEEEPAMLISGEVLSKVQQALNVALSLALLHARPMHAQIMAAALALDEELENQPEETVCGTCRHSWFTHPALGQCQDAQSNCGCPQYQAAPRG